MRPLSAVSLLAIWLPPMLSILFSKVLWLGVGGVALVGGVWWILYERYFHPAWRKNRRLIRACRKAFKDGTYELVRIRRAPHGHGPSGADFYPPPLGPAEIPGYFTYRIDIGEEAEPDFSEVSRRERRLIRRYLHRDLRGVVHHGKEVLRAREDVSDSSTAVPS